MKVWMNNLKVGDIFYIPRPNFNLVMKYENLGTIHDGKTLMTRIKAKILNDSIFKDLYSTENFFVCQYAYDDYESAYDELIKGIQKNIEECKVSIIEHEASIKRLKERLSNLTGYLEKNNENSNSN